jgi:hypothetical protein
MPQYIILKPSFIGGFRERKNGFQLKSIILGGGLRLLWSNIGLNAIAQWTFTT